MKTVKQAITDYPQHKKIINAVLRQLGGKSCLEDVYRNGISSGYYGFIYYTDTHNFAMKNRNPIITLLEEQAFDIYDGNVVELVKSFSVFRRNGMNKDELRNLYRYLGGAKVEQGGVTNVMAWYAAEEVARMFCYEY